MRHSRGVLKESFERGLWWGAVLMVCLIDVSVRQIFAGDKGRLVISFYYRSDGA